MLTFFPITNQLRRILAVDFFHQLAVSIHIKTKMLLYVESVTVSVTQGVLSCFWGEGKLDPEAHRVNLSVKL